MRRRDLIGAVLLGGIVATLTGCGPKTAFTAPPMKLDDGVHVEVSEAFTRGDRIFVEAWVTNDNKKKTIRVNPNGFAVKLPTGELVGRRVFAKDGDVYVLGPGQQKRVDVDFRQEGYDLSGLSDMLLIVGGISIGESSTEYVVGEIPMERAPEPKASPAGAAAGK